MFVFKFFSEHRIINLIILIFSEKWQMQICGQFNFFFYTQNRNETNPEIKKPNQS